MRTEKLRQTFLEIKENTIAPNIIISGEACRKKLRILEIPIMHQRRQASEVSLKGWKVFKDAFKSFAQTVMFRFGNKNRVNDFVQIIGEDLD